MTAPTPREAAVEAVVAMYPSHKADDYRSTAERTVALIEAAGLTIIRTPPGAQQGARRPDVAVGQVWADPSSPGRTVHIVAVPSSSRYPDHTLVETLTASHGSTGAGVGLRRRVRTAALAERFRLVQHADGSPA